MTVLMYMAIVCAILQVYYSDETINELCKLQINHMKLKIARMILFSDKLIEALTVAGTHKELSIKYVAL